MRSYTETLRKGIVYIPHFRITRTIVDDKRRLARHLVYVSTKDSPFATNEQRDVVSGGYKGTLRLG